ncbi:MAG TPA: hypothetical protein ENI95_07950 [Chloroflexi bacterium]|nr:hypothetical protein [Chloroflexota bacterium]
MADLPYTECEDQSRVSHSPWPGTATHGRTGSVSARECAPDRAVPCGIVRFEEGDRLQSPVYSTE